MRIAYNNDKGTCSIVIPVGAVSVDDMVAKLPNDVVSHILIDENDPNVKAFLADRKYRNAWLIVDGKIGVDAKRRKEVYGV